MDEEPEDPPEGSVISIAEQRLARQRARLDLPTVQRDFNELWEEADDPRHRSGNHGRLRLTR